MQFISKLLAALLCILLAASPAVSGSMTLLGVGKAGATAPFTPASLPNLVAWYKADAGVFTDTGCSTPATNSTAAACWADQSGHGYNLIQVTSGNRPTFLTSGLGASKPSLQITAASNQAMVTASTVVMGSGNQGSGFFVGQESFVGASGRALLYAGGGGLGDTAAGSGIFAFNPTGAFDLAGHQNGTSFGTQVVGSNTTFQFGAIFDGTNGTTYLNNSASGTTAVNNNWVSLGVIAIGANWNGSGFGGNSYGGLISEIVITSGALSSGDRASLATYFSGRW